MRLRWSAARQMQIWEVSLAYCWAKYDSARKPCCHGDRTSEQWKVQTESVLLRSTTTDMDVAGCVCSELYAESIAQIAVNTLSPKRVSLATWNTSRWRLRWAFETYRLTASKRRLLVLRVVPECVLSVTEYSIPYCSRKTNALGSELFSRV